MNTTISEPAAADGQDNKCHLLGPFAVLVQAALGALALLSLVYKRWRERPQRPIKIWAFDVSKQVFGSVLLHLANLFMSMLSAGEIEASIAKAAAESLASGSADKGSHEAYRPNPCSFYLLNLAIDTTLGIPILLLILKVLHYGASKTPIARPPESIKSGNYGNPPRATWWLKQSVLYFIGLLGMKLCVLVIFELCPWIVLVGDWALKWTEGNTALQIAFVMLIFPLIMNAMQYYIIDTFIKNKPMPDEHLGEGAEGGSDGEHERFLADQEPPEHSNEEAVRPQSRKDVKASSKPSLAPYDPAKDGEAETLGGGSSGGSSSSLVGQPRNSRTER